MHAVWILEQPSGSSDVLPYHDRLDWYINEVAYVLWHSFLNEKILNFGRVQFEFVWGLQVFRTDFWMMQWGAECPKRSTLWSNHGDIIGKMVWVPARPGLI